MNDLVTSEVNQLSLFPKTRYMGSKTKLLGQIAECSTDLKFDRVFDPFAGSGIVSYMFKARGYSVRSNDHMAMNSIAADAMIANSHCLLPYEITEEISRIDGNFNGYISKTFNDLYFSDQDNSFLDSARLYIEENLNGYEKSIAITALVRSCLKKRPRGIFTYTGNRYGDGRRDLEIDLRQHFVEQTSHINAAIFDNGNESSASKGNALDIEPLKDELVYLDPPYFSPHSDNDYVRRYHFVEGLAISWEGLELQENTKTKKFKSYKTPFSTRVGTYEAFELMLEKYKNNPILLSYSSNSLPNKEDLLAMFRNGGREAEVKSVDHVYSFGTQKTVPNGQRNRVQEYIFVVQ